MVNFVAFLEPLIHWLMKFAGVKPHLLEIKPGTTINFWVPSVHTLKNGVTKPVVVLVHGFAADGIITWLFQVASLTKNYSLYIPDLLFFGASSMTDSPDRSPEFQADCLAAGLRKLGVESCTVVGFSYGGMVAFKMAEMYPDLVKNMVISGSTPAMTDSISETILSRLGFSSLADFLLPKSVKGCKSMLSVAVYKKLWFPDRLYRDFLEVMFNNRKEKSELLEALIISNQDPNIPSFPQRIHLLWGENDELFKLEHAHNMKEQLGDNTTFQCIEKAGHLANLERPFVYNKYLNEFLTSVHKHKIGSKPSK